ncbi:MAG: PilN domain-containing protein [Gallionellaceae bacterium]
MTNKIQDARPPRFGFDRNSPLARFWRWWSDELVALMPQWLRQSGVNAANSLLIEITPQAIVLQRMVQGVLTEQGRLELQSGEPAANGIAFQALFTRLRRNGENVALLLTDTQFLVKRIELPSAALENLRQVLSFEMDRHTPFKAEQVYFGFRTLHQDNSRNRITVNLIIAPRPSVDDHVELLTRWGIPVQAVYAAGGPENGDDGAINLLPNSYRAIESSGLGKLNLGLTLLTLVLAMIALFIPVWQKRQASIELIPLVESAKQQATATETIRHEQEKLAAEYNFMLDKKEKIPPVIVVLDELSGLLPDDTWVQQFSLKGKELQIQGETGSSSKLIALLESSRIFHNSSFRSPLTKGVTPNSERYQLVTEVKPLTLAELKSWPPSLPPNSQSVQLTNGGSIDQNGSAGTTSPSQPAKSTKSGEPAQQPTQSFAPPDNPALARPQAPENIRRRSEHYRGAPPRAASALPQPAVASSVVPAPDAESNPVETAP